MTEGNGAGEPIGRESWEAPGVNDTAQHHIAYRPVGQVVNRRDHRHLRGKPGHAAPTPLRELSTALFELADRLASQSELD